MKYTYLTSDDQQNIIAHKMRDLEAAHFKNTLDLRIASVANTEEMRASAELLIAAIESALEVCTELLTDLQEEA